MKRIKQIGASLRPRLSALPSVGIPVGHKRSACISVKSVLSVDKKTVGKKINRTGRKYF